MAARLAVAITAALITIMNLAVLFWFDTSWMIADPISLIVTAFASWQVTRLIMEKRRGRHRSTKADTSNSEAEAFVQAVLARHHALPGSGPSSSNYPSSSSRSGVTGVETPADEIERVESDMPILAHRSARLCLDGTRKYFRSVVRKDERFGVDAEASCTEWARMASCRMMFSIDSRLPDQHKAPGPSCTCGFYALPTDLAPTYEAPGYVTLMVELSGTVIEHEKGYRAEHQRVIECQVGPCVYCGAEADLLVVRSFTMEQATCAAHKPIDEPGVVYLDIIDLAALLPVPVTRAGRRKESV